MRRARITEVAARARTSAITVSRVLRQPERVAPATRKRVMAAIDALGYIPNLSASSLASRRSGFVALLLPTIGNSIFAETVRGVTDAVTAAGLQLLIGDFRYSEEDERSLTRALIGRQPEALVVVGVVRDPPLRKMLARLAIPVVETWDLTDDPVDTVVGFSNHGAGAAMARHLLQRGRRRLAFISGKDHRAAARYEGFAAALAAVGAAAPHRELVDDIGVGEGRQALARVLDAVPRVEGVFFATDVLAVGGLFECQSRGLAVPAQLALAGLGDLEIGRELAPALTTVGIPAYAIGRQAGEIVVSRLSGIAPQRRVWDLGFSILARSST